MEHLLRRDEARRKAFGMVAAQEGFKHLAVDGKPVRPEIVPHQFAGCLELLVHERQRALAGRGVFQSLEAFRVGLLERLEDRCREPRMLLD